MKHYILVLGTLFWTSLAFSASPNWTVNPVDYQFSMNITGVLVDTCNFSGEIGDSIAAFEGVTVRGVGEIMQTVNGKHLVFLTVYSNLPNGETLTFQHYSLSQDIVQPLNVTISFVSSGVNGNTTNPYQLFKITPILTPTISGLNDSTLIVKTDYQYVSSYQWYKNGTLIVGANDSILEFDSITSEDYTVEVMSVDGCEIISPPFNPSLNTIAEEYNISQDTFDFFPNPFREQLNISFKEKKQRDIEIIDLTGKIVFSKKSNTNYITIKTDVLKKGIYFIRINSGSKLISKQIIKY